MKRKASPSFETSKSKMPRLQISNDTKFSDLPKEMVHKIGNWLSSDVSSQSIRKTVSHRWYPSNEWVLLPEENQKEGMQQQFANLLKIMNNYKVRFYNFESDKISNLYNDMIFVIQMCRSNPTFFGLDRLIQTFLEHPHEYIFDLTNIKYRNDLNLYAKYEPFAKDNPYPFTFTFIVDGRIINKRNDLFIENLLRPYHRFELINISVWHILPKDNPLFIDITTSKLPEITGNPQKDKEALEEYEEKKNIEWINTISTLGIDKMSRVRSISVGIAPPDIVALASTDDTYAFIDVNVMANVLKPIVSVFPLDELIVESNVNTQEKFDLLAKIISPEFLHQKWFRRMVFGFFTQDDDSHSSSMFENNFYYFLCVNLRKHQIPIHVACLDIHHGEYLSWNADTDSQQIATKIEPSETYKRMYYEMAIKFLGPLSISREPWIENHEDVPFDYPHLLQVYFDPKSLIIDTSKQLLEKDLIECLKKIIHFRLDRYWKHYKILGKWQDVWEFVISNSIENCHLQRKLKSMESEE